MRYRFVALCAVSVSVVALGMSAVAPARAHASYSYTQYDRNGYPVAPQINYYTPSYYPVVYPAPYTQPAYYYSNYENDARSNRYDDDIDRWDDNDRYDRYDRDRDDDRHDDYYERDRWHSSGSLSVSRHDGVPGMRVTVAGSAFPRNSRITIYFGSIPAGTVYSDNRGTFRTVVHVPDRLSGLVYVTATGANSANPPTFYVEHNRHYYDYYR